jgi:HEPN domain-containing protein
VDQRFLEAETLLRNGHTTGAVYLAGYAVECALKAALLSAVRAADHARWVERFRKEIKHDLVWLRTELRAKHAVLPDRINVRFITVRSNWSTDMRYTPGVRREQDARDFLVSAAEIVKWCKEGN